MSMFKKPVKLSRALITRYLRKLEGPEGCNFHRTPKTKEMRWRCKGGTDKSLSTKVLRGMGVSSIDIARIHAVATKAGGHCDCEILFNATEALRAKKW